MNDKEQEAYDYEVEICEICKNAHYYDSFDPATYITEHTMTCSKGHKSTNGKYKYVEVHECEDFQKEFNHKNCKNYIPQNDGCILYYQLGAFNVSQYNCCYEKLIGWDE